MKARGHCGIPRFACAGGRANVRFCAGAGDISIGSQNSFSDVSEMGSRGGELRDTDEANDISRSEARNSSTSSRGC